MIGLEAREKLITALDPNVYLFVSCTDQSFWLTFNVQRQAKLLSKSLTTVKCWIGKKNFDVLNDFKNEF